MSNVEIVGIVVIGLSALLVLIAQLINITSKLTQPFKELTDAINGLKLLVERLTIGHENIENEVKWHDERLKSLEERTKNIEYNCMKRNHQ